MPEILHGYSGHTLINFLKILTSWPQRSRPQVTLSDPTSSCCFFSSKFESLSKAHQRSKLFETRRVQYGHRYLQFLYLGCFISVTSGHVNFMTFPLWVNGNKNEVPLMRIRTAQLTQNRNQIGYAWYPRSAVASFPRWKVIWGHMTSSDHRTFFANNFW